MSGQAEHIVGVTVHSRRGEILNYIANKYGRENVAQIITYGTLGAKAALRDMGRVLDIPLGEVDRVAKLIPSLPVGTTIASALERVPESAFAGFHCRDDITGRDNTPHLVTAQIDPANWTQYFYLGHLPTNSRLP